MHRQKSLGGPLYQQGNSTEAPRIKPCGIYKTLNIHLGQIVSNAIKYSSDSPMLTISMIHSEIADVLSVEDNGIGVKTVSYTHLDVYKRQVLQ